MRVLSERGREVPAPLQQGHGRVRRTITLKEAPAERQLSAHLEQVAVPTLRQRREQRAGLLVVSYGLQQAVAVSSAVAGRDVVVRCLCWQLCALEMGRQLG